MKEDTTLSLKDLLQVDKEQFEQCFREPLTDIYLELQRRRHSGLSEAEFKYVCHVLLAYHGIPMNMDDVANGVEGYKWGKLGLRGKIVTAETTLLMIGFFGQCQLTWQFWRGRNSYPTDYYIQAARHLYWEAGQMSGKQVYNRMGHNIAFWMFALSALSEHFESQRLAPLIITKQ